VFVRVVVAVVNKQYSITLPVRRIFNIRLAIRTDLGQFPGAIPVRLSGGFVDIRDGRHIPVVPGRHRHASTSLAR